MSICRRCGWPAGGPGCRAAHQPNLAPHVVAARMAALPAYRPAARFGTTPATAIAATPSAPGNPPARTDGTVPRVRPSHLWILIWDESE
jgi:hypothetical protein